MLHIQKLYIWEFFRVLVVLTLGIAVIFSTIGLIDRLDDFMIYKPSLWLILIYSALSIPLYVTYLLPVATLLSSLFIFSQAIMRREIVIIKSAGGKMRTVLRPFVFIGVLLTLLGFAIGELLVPQTSKEMQSIRNQITGRGKTYAVKEGTVYIKGKDGSIVKIGLFLPDTNVGRHVNAFKFEADRLVARIDAEEASWNGNVWRLRGVTINDIVRGTREHMDHLDYTPLDPPEVFRQDLMKVEQLTIGELVAYQRRLKEAGFKNVKFSVDISSRLSYPLINFFMLLLGISLAVGEVHPRLGGKLTAGAHGHTGIVSAGLGLVISLLYWFSYSFTLTLGYAGSIPPSLAPWIVPTVFGAAALLLYRHIPE